MRISDWSSDVCSSDLFAMVRRRAVAAEIETAIGNHSFRATGITTYLKNGGTLETAATMANHSSTRTKIGRAHVCTPVTNAHLVCRLLIEKKKALHRKLVQSHFNPRT